MSLPGLSLRNAELPDLVELLKQQADVRYDAVIPASRIRSVDGRLVVVGGAARVTDDGVEEADAILAPTDICDEGIAEKLGIPRAYLRSMRATKQRVASPIGDDFGRLDDLNINGWLQEAPGKMFLVRGFRTDDPDELGIARAFLSDRYAPIDNYDVLLAGLDGIRAAGVEVDIHSANLTERNMRLSVSCPQVTALAPGLLARYRTPFGEDGLRRDGGGGGRMLGTPGHEYRPETVFAGFEIRNSETGGGAFAIVPRIVIRICSNGLTVTADALKQVHLGGRLDEGIVKWSEDTQRRSLELVRAKVTDAVRTFLSPEYVAKVVAGIEETSGKPIADVQATIQRVAKVHAFSDAEASSILDCFIRSGDVTAGGVMQAVTAAAQMVDNPDRAAELEDVALDVLATAARS